MFYPLPHPRRLLMLLVLPLALAACDKLSQQELLDRAQQSFDQGKFDAAEIDVKNALQEDPANAEGQRLLGEVRLQRRELEEAASAFGKSLDSQQDPAVAALYAEALLGSGQQDKLVELQEDGYLIVAVENPGYLAILARAQAVSGDTFSAADTLDAALALDSANAQVQLSRALLLVQHSQDVEAALDVLQELTETHGDFADAWSFYGKIARVAGDGPLAERAYRAAVQLNRFRLDDRLSLVAVLVDQEKYAEAALQLESLEKVIPGHPGVKYARARIAMSEGDTKQALEALTEVFNVAPNHMPSVYLAANAQFRAGNLESAETHLKTFLGAQPLNINARQMLASVYLRTGETDEAEKLARQLVKESPMNVNSLKILAMTLAAQGLHSASAEVYQQQSALTPNAPEVHMALGAELVSAGDLERGIEELEKAKSLDPENHTIRTRLVLAYLANGDESAGQRELEEYRALAGPSVAGPDALAGAISMRAGNKEQAAEFFSKALAIDPSNASSRMALATMAMQQDDSDEALSLLQDGLKVEPGNLQYLLSLAAVYEKRGDVDAMVETLAEAVQANPEALEPRLQLGRYYFKEGRPGDTIDVLSTVQQLHDQDARLQQLLVGAYLAKELPGNAVIAGRKLVKLLPENPLALRLAAQAELANGDPAMAEQYLRNAVAAQPEDVDTRKLLIQSLMLQNKVEESSAELALMPEGTFESDRVDLARGEIELALGKPVEAEALLRKAYAAKPNNTALALLNVALMRQGKLDQAQQLGESWLASHPEDQLILRQIGPGYISQGREDKAIAVYEKLNELSPGDALVLNNLAWASRKKDPKRALEYAGQALQAAPDNPALLDTKAMILMELGEYDHALRENQKVLDATKNTPGFLLHRAEIFAAAGNSQDAVAVIEGLLADERFAEDSRLKALLDKYQAL